VKVMTDGILLAEIQRDRQLRRYDTLIIDEAHERSLNIDFILGYLKRLLPRRPDLKVIITSATIDPERFARHFGGEALVVPAKPETAESEAVESEAVAPEAVAPGTAEPEAARAAEPGSGDGDGASGSPGSGGASGSGSGDGSGGGGRSGNGGSGS